MGLINSIKERAKKLKTDIPAVFLALKHEKTPFMAKFLAGITVAYALSPIDLIPDFIPIIGYLDDVLLLPVLVAWTIKLIPPNVMEECPTKSEGLWDNGKPKKWYFAVPILLFWLIIVGLILKAIFMGSRGD